MYFVMDGTKRCGFYECSKCSYRFLDEMIFPTLVCPNCGEAVDMEIGPDEEMPESSETARLLEVIEGAEEVEKMDTLLSLAITGGDDSWI